MRICEQESVGNPMIHNFDGDPAAGWFQSKRSAALYARARVALPGGTARTSTFSFPHPLYVMKGEGCRIVDADGVVRIDFHGNFTAMIHGHCHPIITKAIMDQLSRGTAFCFTSEREIELAEFIRERVSSIDTVRFMCSGSEAVMMAIKAARAYTGRPKIVKCEGAFHGGYDHAQVSLHPHPGIWGNPDPVPIACGRGVPESVLDEVVVIPFNDPEGAVRILSKHAGKIAGILLDPLPNRVGLIPAQKTFIHALRRFASEHDCLLISDEVISLRLASGGAQEAFEFHADLTVLGKIIGGGFPVGAVGGSTRFMKVFDPTGGEPAVPQSGTFAGNPVAMAAGVATLKILDEDSIHRLNRLGDRVRQLLRDAIAATHIEAQITGEGSLFRIHFNNRPLLSYRDAYPKERERRLSAALYRFLLTRGIVMTDVGMGSLSTPMTEVEIQELAEVMAIAFDLIAKDEEEFISRYKD